ncbi:MAG: hypothetical protein AB7P12_02840 [Alphaproteobacteria bacterium]
MHISPSDAGLMASTALLWWLAISIPFAIGAYFVAGRMGRNRWVWAILTVMPVVNVFFYIYALFAVLLYVLDRLNEVTGRTRAG